MADIPSWLRGFQRAQVSHTTSGYHELLEVIRGTTEDVRVAQSTSRKLLYRKLGRCAAAPSSNQSQPHLNQVEEIWHNPDPDQMAETLKVAMMTQSSFDPLRVPYNSCILHVLEAYHQMRTELIEKDREIQDLKKSHENDVRRLRQQESQWKEKEDNYKNEMKRLEVMLSTEARGLELVTLARTMSTLNRSTGAKATESTQNNREKELEYVARTEETMMCDFAEKKDSFTSANYALQKRALDAGHVSISLRPHRSGGYLTLGRATTKAEYESYENDKNCDTAHVEQACSKLRSSTNSNLYSGLKQEAEHCPELRPSLSRVAGSKDGRLERVQRATYSGKPQPDTPGHFDYESFIESRHTVDGKHKPFLRKTLRSDLVTHHRSFSFIPGDDFGNLTFVNMKTQDNVRASIDNGDNGKRPCSLHPSDGVLSNGNPARKTRQAWPVIGIESDQDRVGHKLADCSKTKPEGDSSQSNIPLVGRHHYVENKSDSKLVHNTSRSPEVNRRTGSDEAKTAAVRAIAMSEKMGVSFT